MSYYLYCFNGQLFLVCSPLGAVLTLRLLLHVEAPDDARVYGVIAERDIIWFKDERPERMVELSHFIEPRVFNNDKDGKMWSLLHKSDAVALHKYWMNTASYAEVPATGKHNYFKNSVDSFKHNMENTWFKQTK